MILQVVVRNVARTPEIRILTETSVAEPSAFELNRRSARHLIYQRTDIDQPRLVRIQRRELAAVGPVTVIQYRIILDRT